MPLRIATWNINSVRLRIDLVRRFVEGWSPDVLCLQETKTRNPTFPKAELEALGYRHRLIHGMKGYNGVAILSRVPFAPGRRRRWCERSDCRHLVARFESGLELHNFYVPAGGDLYMAKTIIHDWQDAEARKILENVRRAMRPGGTVVLYETVVTPPNQAHFAKLLDIEMVVHGGGRERTESEYRELLRSSGFTLSRVIPTAGPMSIIEAKPG